MVECLLVGHLLKRKNLEKKNDMKAQKYIIIIAIGIVSCIIGSSCKEHQKSIEAKYLYDWHELPYHNQSENIIIQQLGLPQKDTILKVFRNAYKDFFYRSLIHLTDSATDTVWVKELVWKKDSNLLFLWFVRKNNIWMTIDGIQYNPNQILF